MINRKSNNVIIIGGGLAGVSTLYELASRGIFATLLEANEQVASETSFANGGMLTPSMPDPWNSPGIGKHLLASFFDPDAALKLRPEVVPGLAVWGLQFLQNSLPVRHTYSTIANYRLAAYSTPATDELGSSLKLSYDAIRTGSLKVFETAEAIEGPLAVAKLLEPFGLNFRHLDRDQTLAMEPQLAEFSGNIAGALLYPDDRGGDARKFTAALSRKAEELGAHIRTGAVVSSLMRDGDSIVGAQLDTGEYIYGDVVLAAGVNAPALSRMAGVRLPIKPAKGYSLTFNAEGLGNAMPVHPVIDDAKHVAVVPIGSRLRVVGTAEFTGEDKSIRPERIENLFRFFKRVYPHLAARVDRSTEIPWAGLRPMSADGRPFIGSSPRKGLWLNCGHGHLGWTNASGAARLLADLMLGVQPGIDISPYSYARR